MNEVEETIKAANIYLDRLELLEQDVQTAQEQIKTTSNSTQKEIEVTFNSLIEKICEILAKRRDDLTRKVLKIREESLAPLIACRRVINDKIKLTNKLINQGNSLLNGIYEDGDEFRKNSSNLGSLPEIPELKQVPYVSFHFNKGSEGEIMGICSRFGDVFRIAPVQISKLTEKPGGILVEWQSIIDDDDERITEIQTYRLQRTFGNVTIRPDSMVHFSDCYRGSETQFLVNDLQIECPYSFRVCCKFEGSTEWSPWSLPQVSHTTLGSYSWEWNDDYIFSNQDRIAKSAKDFPSTLLSRGPQFRVGYSVEFTILEVGNSTEVGLISNLSNTKNLRDADNHFIISNSGEIIVDGIKKSTVLPKLKNGSKVCFTCELCNEEKVRVNVDASDKRVTYEWPIDKEQELYLAASFTSTNSKIMVE